MIGLSWKIKFEKSILFLEIILVCSVKTPILYGLRQKWMNPSFSSWNEVMFWSVKWIFPNLSFQLHPIITQLILAQLTCSLPKNVTTFHGKQDRIIYFCLSPHYRGVLELESWPMDFTDTNCISNNKINIQVPYMRLC